MPTIALLALDTLNWQSPLRIEIWTRAGGKSSEAAGKPAAVTFSAVIQALNQAGAR